MSSESNYAEECAMHTMSFQLSAMRRSLCGNAGKLSCLAMLVMQLWFCCAAFLIASVEDGFFVAHLCRLCPLVDLSTLSTLSTFVNFCQLCLLSSTFANHEELTSPQPTFAKVFGRSEEVDKVDKVDKVDEVDEVDEVERR
jgi:hypothetical protein